MFEEYSRVRIKKTGVIGVIVDVAREEKPVRYLVESESEAIVPSNNVYASKWPLYECFEEELERI